MSNENNAIERFDADASSAKSCNDLQDNMFHSYEQRNSFVIQQSNDSSFESDFLGFNESDEWTSYEYIQNSNRQWHELNLLKQAHAHLVETTKDVKEKRDAWLAHAQILLDQQHYVSYANVMKLFYINRFVCRLPTKLRK